MKDNSSFLDAALDGTLGYDPLGAFAEIETEETAEDVNNASMVEAIDSRSADERIADLFRAMAPQRKTLKGIIEFCATPKETAEFDKKIEQLQESKFSVYSPAAFARQMLKEGAIKRVTADGSPYPEEALEPELVEIDGTSFYHAVEAPEEYWQATDEALTYIAADVPMDHVAELFDEEADYAPIYERVLEACAQEGGASVKALSGVVDYDPLVQNPRLYAPYFVERLEKCEAVEWQQAWCVTEVGKQALHLAKSLQVQA